jgi:hypothetical protein
MSVDSTGGYIDYRTYAYTFRTIFSAVNLYFVITVKSYTKLLKWPTKINCCSRWSCCLRHSPLIAKIVCSNPAECINVRHYSELISRLEESFLVCVCVCVCVCVWSRNLNRVVKAWFGLLRHRTTKKLDFYKGELVFFCAVRNGSLNVIPVRL